MSNENEGRKYKCGKCGNEVNFGAAYCSACGTKLNWPETPERPLEGRGNDAIPSENPVASVSGASGGPSSKEQYTRYSKGFLTSFAFNIASSACLFVGASLAFLLPIFKLVIPTCDKASGSCTAAAAMVSPLWIFLHFNTLGSSFNGGSSSPIFGVLYAIIFSILMIITLIASAVALGLNIYKAAKIQETSLFLFDAVKKGTKDRRDNYANPMPPIVAIFTYIITEYLLLYVLGLSDSFGFSVFAIAPIAFFGVALALTIVSAVKKNTIKKMILSEDYNLKK